MEFVQSLVRMRRVEQGSFQKAAYRQQETSHDLYPEQQVLFGEDVSQKLKQLEEDYQANLITLGRKKGEYR